MTMQKYILLISLLVGATLPTMLWAADIDTDNDGFTDSEEAFIGTDPNDSDTDDDGILDSAEALVYTDPLLYDTITTDAYTSDYELDTDADGLSNGYELYDGRLGDMQVGNFTGEGGNPVNPDTDEDGLGDWFEATYAGTCVDITIDNSDHDDTTDANEDCDNDGLINSVEEDLGTSPLASDTDGDGFSDAAEATAGSDPTDELITPDTILEESEEVDDGVDEEVDEEEEQEVIIEEPTDHGSIVTAVAQVEGKVLVTYSDSTTLTIDAFTGSATPRVKLTPDSNYIIIVKRSGTTLKVYDAIGQYIGKRQIYTHEQQRTKLRVYDVYSDGTSEIIVVGKRKQTLRTTAVTLTASGKLKNKNTKVYSDFTGTNVKVKLKKKYVQLRHDGSLVVRYRLQQDGDLQ